MNTHRWWLALMIAWLALSGCAHTGGPLVPLAPEVRVLQFHPVGIDPEGIQFEVLVEMENRMPVTLPLEGIDYQFDCNHRRLGSGRFTSFQTFGRHGKQTITFPFRITWDDLLAQIQTTPDGPDFLITFQGVLTPGGIWPLPPVPFHMEKAFPVPKLPQVSFVGTEGSPFNRFALVFRLQNGNRFPIWIEGVDSDLTLNGKVYSLFRGAATTRLEPGTSDTLRMEMTQSLSKGVSMLVNVLSSRKMDFSVSGRMNFGSPFGTIRIPIEAHGRTE